MALANSSTLRMMFCNQIFDLTCLYTELAKSYFLLGPIMAEENTDDEWLTHEPEYYPLGEEEE